jgi:hypothetical protein
MKLTLQPKLQAARLAATTGLLVVLVWLAAWTPGCEPKDPPAPNPADQVGLLVLTLSHPRVDNTAGGACFEHVLRIGNEAGLPQNVFQYERIGEMTTEYTFLLDPGRYAYQARLFRIGQCLTGGQRSQVDFEQAGFQIGLRQTARLTVTLGN